MNWERIEIMLENTTVQPGTQVPNLSSIPGDYALVLRRINGVEGFVGYDQYLILWPFESLQEMNRAYSMQTYAPNVLLIGTDGSDTGFGLSADGKYVSVSLVGMAPEDVKELGGGFLEFLERLASA